MSEKLQAVWSISLDCDCPGCGDNVDLMRADDFWDGRHFEVPEHDTARTTDVEVVCPDCGHEFIVDLAY